MSVERAIALLHIGKLVMPHRQSLCLVRTLAIDHAIVRASLPVTPGSGVTLGLRNGLSIAASVDKVQGEQVRLRYPKPIAVDRQVAEQARGRTGPESVRVAVSGHVTVEADGRKIIALLRDISLFGIQIADASAALQPGAQVTIRIAGLTQRLATVRWQADGYAGLRFAHSIGYELLDNWLIMQGGADHQSLPRFRNAAEIR